VGFEDPMLVAWNSAAWWVEQLNVAEIDGKRGNRSRRSSGINSGINNHTSRTLIACSNTYALKNEQ
jgi:hypothetical protein